jgi:hypothetical protein
MAIKTLFLGHSWWFSLCYVVLRGPSLHGPTSISLVWLYKIYICVPHWCWLVAPIAWDFIGWWIPCCLGCSWWFSPLHIMLRGPSLHGPTSISLLGLYKGYICVPHRCCLVALIYWNFNGYKNAVSGPLMVVFTLSCHTMWPIPPGMHLNFSVTIIQRLYLCSTLVLGCSTHFLGL